MKEPYKGFLLLETMVAMVVVVSGVLFIFGGIVFMLSENKRCEEELEMAILLYEMSSMTSRSIHREKDIEEKAESLGIEIVSWEKENIRIESEFQSLEIEIEIVP